MPTHKVKNGYKWGKTGKVYPTKQQADAQGAAIYASGWKENKTNESKIVRITESDIRKVIAQTLLESMDADLLPDEAQWKDAYKNIFGEYPNIKKSKKSNWENDEQLDEPHTKEDEINASWEAYENTMDDENGEIPTSLSHPDSMERYAYKTLKDKRDEYVDTYSDGDYSILCGDYPSKFTDNFDGYHSMLAQGYDPFLKQYTKNENKEYKTNMKQIVRLTETDLHRIIKESVKQVIRESRDLNFYNPWLNGEASYFRGKYDINGYHVEIDELYNILIQNGEDEYFLQGDEADDLIYDMCLAWENNPNKSKEEIIYAFIQQY